MHDYLHLVSILLFGVSVKVNLYAYGYDNHYHCRQPEIINPIHIDAFLILYFHMHQYNYQTSAAEMRPDHLQNRT